MLILPIEKEIETEHKVLFGLNMRQTIFAALTVVDIGVFYFMTKDMFLSGVCAAPLAAIFIYLGWYTKFELTPEELALRKLQEKYFKNSVRKYRTKNRYFALVNEALSKKRRRDFAEAGGKKNKSNPHKPPVSHIKSY